MTVGASVGDEVVVGASVGDDVVVGASVGDGVTVGASVGDDVAIGVGNAGCVGGAQLEIRVVNAATAPTIPVKDAHPFILLSSPPPLPTTPLTPVSTAASASN